MEFIAGDARKRFQQREGATPDTEVLRLAVATEEFPVGCKSEPDFVGVLIYHPIHQTAYLRFKRRRVDRLINVTANIKLSAFPLLRLLYGDIFTVDNIYRLQPACSQSKARLPG